VKNIPTPWWIPSIKLSTLSTSYPTIKPKTPLKAFEMAPNNVPKNPWNALPVDCSVSKILIPLLKDVMKAHGEILRWERILRAIFLTGYGNSL
jgi:hypothetical protein